MVFSEKIINTLVFIFYDVFQFPVKLRHGLLQFQHFIGSECFLECKEVMVEGLNAIVGSGLVDFQLGFELREMSP